MRACEIEVEADRDGAIAAWASKAPGRVSERLVAIAWPRVLSRGVNSADLRRAVEAAVARDPDFGRDRAVNLDRWLDDARYVGWLTTTDAVPAAGSAKASRWAGPNRVREIVEAAMGAGGVASYLDPAAWDEVRSAVLTSTRLAADRLKDGAGRALKAAGICVEFVGVVSRG